MSQKSHKISKEENYITIQLLESKFTAAIAPELKAVLVELKESGVRNIIMDLNKASYCDSSGLSVILVAKRICDEQKGCLVLCNLQPAVSKLIDISQLNNVLNITPTLSEAVDFIYMDELERGIGDIDEGLN